MYSITSRARSVLQPYDGYLRPSSFNETFIDDGKQLNEKEDVPTWIVGTVVKYMTRFMTGSSVEDAFRISMIGARCAEELKLSGSIKTSEKYSSMIKYINDISIIYACKLVTYDNWYLNPSIANMSYSDEDILPDKDTIENIRTMIVRSMTFFNKYGPIIEDGFTFDGGYTDTVSTGDGYFLTADTIWDFKVLRSKLTSKHTLQLLMYYLMGKHSGQSKFKGVNRIGFFNPRLNCVYLKNIDEIDPDVIAMVENKVIGY